MPKDKERKIAQRKKRKKVTPEQRRRALKAINEQKAKGMTSDELEEFWNRKLEEERQ